MGLRVGEWVGQPNSLGGQFTRHPPPPPHPRGITKQRPEPVKASLPGQQCQDHPPPPSCPLAFPSPHPPPCLFYDCVCTSFDTLCPREMKMFSDVVPLEDLKKLFMIIHHYAASAVAKKAGMNEISAKLIISLVRHCDVIPCDKAFYDAGMAAKVCVVDVRTCVSEPNLVGSFCETLRPLVLLILMTVPLTQVHCLPSPAVFRGMNLHPCSNLRGGGRGFAWCTHNCQGNWEQFSRSGKNFGESVK